LGDVGPKAGQTSKSKWVLQPLGSTGEGHALGVPWPQTGRSGRRTGRLPLPDSPDVGSKPPGAITLAVGGWQSSGHVSCQIGLSLGGLNGCGAETMDQMPSLPTAPPKARADSKRWLLRAIYLAALVAIVLLTYVPGAEDEPLERPSPTLRRRRSARSSAFPSSRCRPGRLGCPEGCTYLNPAAEHVSPRPWPDRG
jgi:hypothetical protein